MEPDVIRMYSSSPPPMEDEDEDDEFGDFGGFSGVPNSVSFTEFDTPAATFNQNQALNATSPPELLNNGGVVVGVSNLSSCPSGRAPADDPPRPNGVVPAGDGRPPDRTAGSDEPRKHADRSRPRRRSNSPAPSGSVQTRGEPADCNGGGEVLTNGFATFEVRETSPSSPQNSVRSRQTGAASAERTPDNDDDGGGDDFADFAAFSNAEVRGHPDPPATDRGGDSDDSEGGDRPADEEGGACRQRPNTEQGSDSEDDVRDAADGLSNGDEGVAADDGSATSEIRDTHEHSAAEAACTKGPAGQNGTDSEGSEEGGGGAGDGVSPNAGADEKGSGDTETETETETSLGRPLSTDALEEYGDASTTGSPPLQEETATPADHSQLAEEEEEEEDDDDGDFGDFGDAGSFGGQGFADFEQPETLERGGSTGAQEMADDEEFGDFDAPPRSHGGTAEDGEGFADFPASDSFADFSSAAEAGADAGWNAFDEPGQGQAGADSWAAFGEEPSGEEGGEDEWREGGGTAAAAAPAPPPPAGDDADRRDSLSASLSGRLEKLFQAAFPETPAPQLGEQVLSLKTLLEPPEKEEDGEAGSPDDGGLRDVWRQLQDIHDAFGLRHQWGGSHSNKTLLRSLGIDTRNILYTGQKKQPVIVPMYAASLGMLEPTKEPVKPISAVEMIASIAQAPPVALEVTCPPDTAQETLPPVQFDWSSSGLTNPLDASGGSSLLNLDFFGPVEDSGSGSSTSIPGVDPELFELTTAKLDPSGPGSRVADAFARLMSTMEKTSTSTTRKPRKEENLSEEASEVIAGLPDLSFMQAKVLMFPATLTPLGCTDPTPD